MPEMTAIVKNASFLGAMKTVAAGFLGIRRREDHDRQTAPIRPQHVVIAGLIGAALFVGILITIVRFVVRG